MKFFVKEIRLWFRNGSDPRVIPFLSDKVNVITGAKSTGKSSILSIIDYCLLSSEPGIPEVVINENVSWYGLLFELNERTIFIARRHPVGKTASKDIYFSSAGEIPTELSVNIDIKQVKSAFEQEFGIDENLIVPYGGHKIQAHSKISFRYFFLFNTLSEDTIAHTTLFFDYNLHDAEKYREALDRIFFLAMGVDEPENVLIKEKIAQLQSQVDKVEKKKNAVEKDTRLFNNEIIALITKAQEYDLIERRPFTHEEAYDQLKALIHHFRPSSYSNNLKELEELNKEKRSIWKKIRNLERFDQEYNLYRENLKGV